MVLKTTSAAGSVSATLRNERAASPVLSASDPAVASGIRTRTLNGTRSIGAGVVNLDEVQKVIEGNISQAARDGPGRCGPRESLHAVRRSVILGNGACSKNSSISSSLPSATSSTNASWRALASAARFAGSLSSFCRAIAAGGVVIGFHRHQVDNSVESLGIGDGQLDRKQLRPRRSTG